MEFKLAKAVVFKTAPIFLSAVALGWAVGGAVSKGNFGLAAGLVVFIFVMELRSIDLSLERINSHVHLVQEMAYCDFRLRHPRVLKEAELATLREEEMAQ